MNKVSFDIFIKMLGELNDFIAKEFDSEYILEVRAIGGFSMIIHKRLGEISGPREESRDIDSLTKDYPDKIIDKIMEIGEKYGADDADGWLNNHWNRTKNYNEEFEFFIKWKVLDEVSFSNIIIYYADLESIFMFKIRAMDNRIELAHLEPREQDILDVVSITRAFGITNFDDIENELIKRTVPYFPHAVNYLIDNNIICGTRLLTENKSKTKFQDTAYGKALISKVEEYNKGIWY
ncbi:MAG: hypothetical protein IJ796_06465 [Lachnospiraceae bacterium]|nr:hypothetical protein [Lachnospiraceae bacterium]